MGVDVVIVAELQEAKTQVVIVHHTGGGLYSEHWVHLRPARKDASELIQLRPAEALKLARALNDAAHRCQKLDDLTQPMQLADPPRLTSSNSSPSDGSKG